MAELAPDSAETRRLLDEVRTGDEAAFGRLFARHRTGLRQFVAHRLDPRVRARLDPSDVVQETQLEVCRRMDDFLARRPMPFHVWLRKTAYERMLKRGGAGGPRRSPSTAASSSLGRGPDALGPGQCGDVVIPCCIDR